jgi:hypothetical protein
MFVPVNETPNLIERQVFVLLPLRRVLSFSLLLPGNLDDVTRVAAGTDGLDTDQGIPARSLKAS